ncbi:protein DGS1, mitochondrial-like [Lolium rigidum]|uniref:protein DGS1, mitochondrial-like n=1 Tax=Lolium rigidum TaxID=89674 RepID=UPI001F5D3A2F|nr:protein DGS1, mitochondrial-like [Lolium rigidum]
MNNTASLIGRRNTWHREGRLWGVPGRTLEHVVDGIRNGIPRLEMRPSPPPSPSPAARLPLVDLTDNGEAGPSGGVKDRPIDEPDEHGKEDIVVDDMYNFHQCYDPSALSTIVPWHERSGRKFYRLAGSIVPQYYETVGALELYYKRVRKKLLNLSYPLTFALSLPTPNFSPLPIFLAAVALASGRLRLRLLGLAAASWQQSFDDKVKNPGGRLPCRREKERKGKGTPISLPRQNARALSLVHIILNDIVHYTLSTLRNIQKSLLYWESIAEGTDLQQMYFMIFERGPRALLETTWQTLAGLRSTSPSQYLLDSAANMVLPKLDALTSMQDCLAAFLAEVYSEVDKCKGRLTESSDQPLHALLTVLNRVFLKLELSLKNLVEVQTASFALSIFQRLPEVDVESSTATSLIYQNLLRLDIYISNKIAVHQKPRNTTIYWLPYTFGAIGLSACSLWLLRHSSFMGSSDMDGSIQDAKESVSGYWDQHAVKLIISIRDGLCKTFKRTDKLVLTKQDVHQIEASLHRCEKELMQLPQKQPGRELALAMPANKIQKHAYGLQKKLLELDRSLKEKKLGQQEAMLELTQILEGNEIKFALCAAWPAFGLCLLLILLVRASVFHDQDEDQRGKMSRLPQRLLLRDAELRLLEFQKCMTNGMEKKAASKFGLMLCDLDRLYKTVELHAKKTGEWSRVREDIVNLAKPHMPMADRLVVLRRLKEMYYCLLPSPSPSRCHRPLS